MDKKTITQLIDSKTKEHEAEIQACSKDLIRVHGVKPKDAEEAGKFLIIKDKVIFHKACIMALTDLKEEIEKLNVGQ